VLPREERLHRLLTPLFVVLTTCAGGPSVSIAAPEDGATVESPFSVSMEADGFTIEPAGDVRQGAGHFHLMVDASCVPRGQTIPEDGNHLHFGDGSTQTELDLPPGEHTLCLQAGDGGHAALELTDEITVTVAEPGGGIGGQPTPTDEPVGTEEWEGTLEGSAIVTGEAPGQCDYDIEGDFRITVDAERTATMEGTNSYAGTCVGKPVPGGSRPFVAIGRRTSTGFRFDDLTLQGTGVIPTITIEVTGDEGAGHYDGPTGQGHGDTMLDFEVKRTSR
jgi:hypothetical protein